MCKPIKNGVTNYALCFSKSAYLYRWRWFTGKGSSQGTPHGQPTDDDVLDEDNAEKTGYIRALLQELIGADFDGTGSVGFFGGHFFLSSSSSSSSFLFLRPVRAVPRLVFPLCCERDATKCSVS